MEIDCQLDKAVVTHAKVGLLGINAVPGPMVMEGNNILKVSVRSNWCLRLSRCQRFVRSSYLASRFRFEGHVLEQ